MSALSDYLYELAQQALNEVAPIPPAPDSPARAPDDEARDTPEEPAVIARIPLK